MENSNNQALKNLNEYIKKRKKKFLNSSEKIIVYVRVSSFASVEKDNSIPKQKELIKDFISNDNDLSKFIVNGEYTRDVIMVEDPAESGLKFDDRPGLVKIRKHIKEDNVSHLLVFKVDRLGRSIGQNAKISEELEKNGVHLISVTESFIDTRKNKSEFYFTLLSMFAQMEIQNIKERTQLAMMNRMSQGYAPPGTTPYGFKRHKSEELNGTIFIPAPYEEDIIRKIFELAALNTSNADISKIIYGMDNDLLFSTSQIMRMIRNPIYKGIVRYNNESRNKRKGKGKEILVKALFDGLVSEKLWQKANDTRKSYTRDKDKYLRKSLFPDKITCPYCGDILQTKNSKSKLNGEEVYYTYYVCRSSRSDNDINNTCSLNKLPMELLEAYIICELIKQVEENNNYNNIKEFHSLVFGQMKYYYSLLKNIDVEAKKAQLTKKIENEDKKLEILRDEFYNNEISEKEYIDRKKLVVSYKKDYQDQINELSDNSSDSKIKYTIAKHHKKELKELIKFMTIGYKIHFENEKQRPYFSLSFSNLIESIHLIKKNDNDKLNIQERYSVKFKFTNKMIKFDNVGYGSILNNHERLKSYKDISMNNVRNFENYEVDNINELLKH